MLRWGHLLGAVGHLSTACRPTARSYVPWTTNRIHCAHKIGVAHLFRSVTSTCQTLSNLTAHHRAFDEDHVTVSTTSPHTETAKNSAAKYRLLLSQIVAGFGLILFPAAFYDTWELKEMFRLDVVELRISTAAAVLLLIIAWAIAPVATPRKLKASAFLVGAFVLALIVYALLQDWVSVYLLFPVLVPIVSGLALAGWFLLRFRPGRSFAALPILLLTPLALFVGAVGPTTPVITAGWAMLVVVPAATAWAGYLVSRGDGGA